MNQETAFLQEMPGVPGILDQFFSPMRTGMKMRDLPRCTSTRADFFTPERAALRSEADFTA